ncbi:hypothetical protein ACTMU2_22000 [Cupriavidus basilensis]
MQTEEQTAGKSATRGAWDQAFALAQRHGLPVSVMTEDAGRLLAPVAPPEGLTLVVDHSRLATVAATLA